MAYMIFMIKMDFAQCSYTSIPDTDDAMKPAAEYKPVLYLERFLYFWNFWTNWCVCDCVCVCVCVFSPDTF